jgi:hypothetical protein
MDSPLAATSGGGGMRGALSELTRVMAGNSTLLESHGESIEELRHEDVSATPQRRGDIIITRQHSSAVAAAAVAFPNWAHAWFDVAQERLLSLMGTREAETNAYITSQVSVPYTLRCCCCALRCVLLRREW